MANSQFTAIIETEAAPPRLAVLIDADNAQVSILGKILDEIATLGEVTLIRIYGDLTTPNNGPWQKAIQQYPIKPMPQVAYTIGKNSADISLVIDAMDLLYAKKFDGFCLVSSDSDFTGLAMRLREAGLKVYGFGEEKTPIAYRNACHKYIFSEILRFISIVKDEVEAPKASSKKYLRGLNVTNISDDLRTLLSEAIVTTSGTDGWANLSSIGKFIRVAQPRFKPRKYGYKKLSDLIWHQTNWLDVIEREDEGQKGIFIRVKLL